MNKTTQSTPLPTAVHRQLIPGTWAMRVLPWQPFRPAADRLRDIPGIRSKAASAGVPDSKLQYRFCGFEGMCVARRGGARESHIDERRGERSQNSQPDEWERSLWVTTGQHQPASDCSWRLGDGAAGSIR